MKRNPHFIPDAYTEWFSAATNTPGNVGWYECRGWRIDGFAHLFWSGADWQYFGPKHVDPTFPDLGSHPDDQWRGVKCGYQPRTYQAGTGKVLDIKGQTFGLLTAIEHVYSTRRGAFWMFQCECGAKRVAQSKWVTSGNTGSCGCRQRQKLSVPIERPWETSNSLKWHLWDWNYSKQPKEAGAYRAIQISGKNICWRYFWPGIGFGPSRKTKELAEACGANPPAVYKKQPIAWASGLLKDKIQQQIQGANKNSVV